MPHTELKLGRLKKRSEFLHVRDGAYAARPGLVIQCRPRSDQKDAKDPALRVGFTATKRVGNAVIRNRSKRRLRAVARDVLPDLGQAGHDYVFIARNPTTDIPWESLLRDAKKALLRLHK